jgi:hypothetical protein
MMWEYKSNTRRFKMNKFVQNAIWAIWAGRITLQSYISALLVIDVILHLRQVHSLKTLAARRYREIVHKTNVEHPGRWWRILPLSAKTRVADGAS